MVLLVVSVIDDRDLPVVVARRAAALYEPARLVQRRQLEFRGQIELVVLPGLILELLDLEEDLLCLLGVALYERQQRRQLLDGVADGDLAHLEGEVDVALARLNLGRDDASLRGDGGGLGLEDAHAVAARSRSGELELRLLEFELGNRN